MTVIVNSADVPRVAAAELYQPMLWLIEQGDGLALLKGLSEDRIRQLEDALWARFDGSAEARVAVALRFRALLAVFAARRLKDLLQHRGFKIIKAAVAEAARERLNTKIGFSAHRFVLALEHATAAERANAHESILRRAA